MNKEITDLSIQIIALFLIGYALYFFIRIVKKKHQDETIKTGIDQIKENSHLEIKKGRGYTGKKFYLVTTVNRRKIRRKITSYEYAIYKSMDISSNGILANEYDKRNQITNIV